MVSGNGQRARNGIHTRRWPRPSLLLLIMVSLLGAGVPSPAGAAESPLSPVEIFSRVSPAIARIETPSGLGSAVLIDEHHLITNAHVVWPYEAVRVRFPNGTEYRTARVVAWDAMGDFAVIWVPGSRGAQPVHVADLRQLPIGAQVYLVGYPLTADEEDVSPTITSGVLSRFRAAEPLGLTYAQTDAAGAPGLSGGALVSATGDVVGFAEFGFGRVFTLAANAREVVDRSRNLLAGADLDGLGRREMSRQVRTDDGVGTRLSVTFSDEDDVRAFLVWPGAGDRVKLTAANESARIAVFDMDGERVAIDRAATGSTSLEFSARHELYLVLVLRTRVCRFVDGADLSRVPDPDAAKRCTHLSTPYSLTATHPLIPYRDADDGRVLALGVPRSGHIDYMGDQDDYVVNLRSGETVILNVESVRISPDVQVLRPGWNVGLTLERDQRLSTIFATAWRFEAAADGRYIFRISSSSRRDGGGYVVSTSHGAPPSSRRGAGTILSGAVPGSGFGLFVFGGGTSDDLIRAAACGDDARFWTIAGAGRFVAFIPGATVSAVNAEWRTLFRFGIPALTPLIGSCEKGPAP